MKRKTVNMLLAMTVAASMGLSAPSVWAAAADQGAGTEESAGETEADAEGETDASAEEKDAGAEGETDTAAEDTGAGAETDAAEEADPGADADGEAGAGAENETDTDAAADTEEAEEKVPEDIKLTLDSGEITIVNKAEIVFAGAEYVKSSGKGEDDAEIWNLVLTEDGEDGTVHTFENVTPEKWTDPAVEAEYGILYITFKNEDGTDGEALETAEEKELEEPVTIYATTDVHVRKEATTESESLKVTSLGAEWQAVAAVPGWVKVEGDGITGYIFHSYVSDDKEMVDQLVKEAEEARAAAAAAAAQAAQSQSKSKAPASQPQAPAPQPQAPAAPYEVSRQKYDDCDGSGHGYWEITMSDGSVVIEEY